MVIKLCLHLKVFGLVVGVGFTLLTIVFRTQLVARESLTRVGDTEVYRKAGAYKEQVGHTYVILVFLHLLSFTFLSHFFSIVFLFAAVSLSRRHKLHDTTIYRPTCMICSLSIRHSYCRYHCKRYV